MVIEVAKIDVLEGSEARFEEGVSTARALFLAAQGCTGVRLWRSIEHPGRYRLIVQWATLEDHTVTFRESPAFASWRALVSDCFASNPEVEHHTEVLARDPV